MKHSSRLIIGCFILLTLGACQNNDLSLEPSDTISVKQTASGGEVGFITDIDFIEKLTIKLNQADTASVSNLDLPSPDYSIAFLSNDEVIQELGYYEEDRSFGGVIGRYLDPVEGIHLAVLLELPID
ncbi:hypothetical protein JCM19046_3190 [Bacillus sp. JCM 19046]|nr:hypothetical protein JCM19045_3789 [Bacillus sp. JCM 19045]GAF18605.1 hypothetical protein JCM19046_3190 [Bacillus sp. JCM 19046]